MRPRVSIHDVVVLLTRKTPRCKYFTVGPLFLTDISTRTSLGPSMVAMGFDLKRKHRRKTSASRAVNGKYGCTAYMAYSSSNPSSIKPAIAQANLFPCLDVPHLVG